MRMQLFGGAAWLAAIIAIALPALEMLGIYLVALQIGWAWTFFWLIADIWLGLSLIRSQHGDLPARLKQALARGENPLGEIWASGRRILAGVLLLLPGPGSDVVALLLLIWPTRRAALPIQPPRRPEEPSVIEGEFRRED